MTRRDVRPTDDGYILVAVLAVMLILSGFMAAGSLLTRSALDAARVGDADVAMAGLTRTGVELTAFQLFVIEASPTAVDGRSVRFAGGTIMPHIVDEGGKADLNASDPKLLASIFQGAGMDVRAANELVACIVALRGPDRNPPPAGSPGQTAQTPDQAPQAPQQADGQPLPTNAAQPQPAEDKPKLRGFQSVDQLRDCHDLNPVDYRAIAPFLTVYNPDGKINILSASPETLAELPGLSQADVALILDRRGSSDKREIGNLMALVKEAKDYGKATYGPAFSVRVEATSATGRKKVTHVVMAASKSQSDPYYVLDWWE